MPVTPEKVRMVAAGLRKGGFRSASAYFGAACIVHLKTYGQRPGCLVTYSIARYSRAVSRGIGPAAGKASFNIEDLVDVMLPPPRHGGYHFLRQPLALRRGLPGRMVDDTIHRAHRGSCERF